jgi:ABC-type uncharacterized transport system permease subunit
LEAKLDLALLLIFSTPLALAGLGEIIGQRGGVINIGLEGMMLIGAFLSVFVTKSTGSLTYGFASAAAAGAVLGALSGLFTIKLAADQVVVGTAINFFALGATGLAYRTAYGQTGQLLNTTALPRWLGIDPVVALMLACIPLVAFLIYRTNWGLALRAAGGYPRAAEAAGFSVDRLRMQGVTLGGLFAGLAGAYLALGVANSFAEGMTAGRGFVAIALVTFGRWRPIYVALAALLIGYCQSLKFSLQGAGIPAWIPIGTCLSAAGILGIAIAYNRLAKSNWLAVIGLLGIAYLFFAESKASIGIPSQLWLALPYVVALAVLVIVGKGTVAPGALGIAYKRER